MVLKLNYLKEGTYLKDKSEFLLGILSIQQVDPENSGGSVITLTNGTSIFVTQSPNDIYKMIHDE